MADETDEETLQRIQPRVAALMMRPVKRANPSTPAFSPAAKQAKEGSFSTQPTPSLDASDPQSPRLPPIEADRTGVLARLVSDAIQFSNGGPPMSEKADTFPTLHRSFPRLSAAELSLALRTLKEYRLATVARGKCNLNPGLTVLSLRLWVDSALRCSKCASRPTSRDNPLAVCDGCQRAWHTKCIGTSPQDKDLLFCPRCRSDPNDALAAKWLEYKEALKSEGTMAATVAAAAEPHSSPITVSYGNSSPGATSPTGEKRSATALSDTGVAPKSAKSTPKSSPSSSSAAVEKSASEFTPEEKEFSSPSKSTKDKKGSALTSHTALKSAAKLTNSSDSISPPAPSVPISKKKSTSNAKPSAKPKSSAPEKGAGAQRSAKSNPPAAPKSDAGISATLKSAISPPSISPTLIISFPPSVPPPSEMAATIASSASESVAAILHASERPPPPLASVPPPAPSSLTPLSPLSARLAPLQQHLISSTAPIAVAVPVSEPKHTSTLAPPPSVAPDTLNLPTSLRTPCEATLTSAPTSGSSLLSPPPPPAVDRIRRHAVVAAELEVRLQKSLSVAQAAREALASAELQTREFAAQLQTEHVALVKLLSDALKDSHRQFYELLEVLGVKMDRRLLDQMRQLPPTQLVERFRALLARG